MANEVVAADGTKLIPVIKANPNIVWETELSADDSDIAAALAYCLDATGRKHTHTTTKGCFTLESFAGKTARSAPAYSFNIYRKGT